MCIVFMCRCYVLLVGSCVTVMCLCMFHCFVVCASNVCHACFNMYIDVVVGNIIFYSVRLIVC